MTVLRSSTGMLAELGLMGLLQSGGLRVVPPLLPPGHAELGPTCLLQSGCSWWYLLTSWGVLAKLGPFSLLQSGCLPTPCLFFISDRAEVRPFGLL